MPETPHKLFELARDHALTLSEIYFNLASGGPENSSKDTLLNDLLARIRDTIASLPHGQI